jgi:hypothetical protein
MSDDDEKKPDPVALRILALIEARGAGKSICPSEVARDIYEEKRKPTDPKDGWRKYMNAVKQQALHLARQGEIDILRRGARQDPTKPIKGVVRLAKPSNDN